jgi:malonate transporter and related proteins
MMLAVFMAVLPVFSLVVVGAITKRFFIKDDGFWSVSDKLVYYMFFPSLLMLKIGEAELSGSVAGTGIIVSVIATSLVGLLAFAYKLTISPGDALFSSIFQGSVRYNSYIFIALSAAFFGSQGVALSGLFIAIMIIFTNVISVMIMNNYGIGAKKGFDNIAKATATNPLIVAALIGVALNLAELNIGIGPLGGILKYLGDAATPLSLMSVGAGLSFALDMEKVQGIAFSIVAKLVALPILALVLISYFNVSGLVGSVALLYCAVPTAGNAYILSRQMGGDSVAMASIITWGTLLSALTIPLLMAFSGLPKP